MKYLLFPVSFLLGTLAGGLLVRYWRARRGGPEPMVRRPKLKLVIATVFATTGFLAVSGYAAFRYKFRSQPVSRATTADAVADYRKAGGTKSASEKGKGVPAGGVYTFRTQGYMKAESALLGKVSRPMPKTIPAVLIHKGNCWELSLRLFKEHERTERYCKTDQGLKLVQRTEKNKMFGITSFNRQGVGPHPLLGPTGKPGSTWTITWKVLENKSSSPIPMKRPDLHLNNTYVGVETLTIAGQKIKAHHLSQVAHYKDLMSGTLKRELWYAVDSGMMLKLIVDSRGSGLGTLRIDRTYVLTSLSPMK